MVLHPIAAFLAFFAFLLALKPNLILGIAASGMALFAFLVCISVMGIDLGLFFTIRRNYQHAGAGVRFGNGLWLVVAAAALLLLASVTVCFTHAQHRRESRRHSEFDNAASPASGTNKKWFAKKNRADSTYEVNEADTGMYMDGTAPSSYQPHRMANQPADEESALRGTESDNDRPADHTYGRAGAGVAGAGVVLGAAAANHSRVSGYGDEDGLQAPYQTDRAYAASSAAGRSGENLIPPGKPGYVASGRVAEAEHSRLSPGNPQADGRLPYWTHNPPHAHPKAI